MPVAKRKSSNSPQREIEMETLVPGKNWNLDNLPADIIRRLLKMHGMRGVERLRLISRNWNAVVLEYLSDRRNHPPLDMLKIDSSFAQWHTKNVNAKLDLADADKDHYQAFRYWPDSDAGIHIDPHTRAKKIQIKSPQLMIGVDKEKAFFSLIYAFIALFAAFRVHIYAAILLLVVMVAVLAWLYFTVAPTVAENRTRLHRIFDRCSGIDALVIMNLDQQTMEIVRETLTDAPVRNLFIVDKKCGSYLRKQIVEMTRLHSVERVTICVDSCKADSLREFFSDVSESTGALYIYEKATKSEAIFGQPRQFWEEATVGMSDGSCAIQVMNGEQLDASDKSSYVLRLKVESAFLTLVATQ